MDGLFEETGNKTGKLDHTKDNWHKPPRISVHFTLGGHCLWTSPQLPLQKKALGLRVDKLDGTPKPTKDVCFVLLNFVQDVHQASLNMSKHA